MTPTKIHFTGLSFDADEILRPRENDGVVPEGWIVHHVAVERNFDLNFDIQAANRWIADQIIGRWTIMTMYFNTGARLVIAFERPEDAALFVLMDGASEMIRFARIK